MLIAITAVIFIVFCVLTFFATKTWRAVHVIFFFLTFIAALITVRWTGHLVRTRTAWMKVHSRLVGNLDDARKLGRILATGDPGESVQSTDTVQSLQKRLDRIILDRGRVWRGTTPATFNDAGGNYEVSINLVPAGMDPNLVLPPQQDLFVYIFEELSITDANSQEMMVPGVYLGEFRVSKVDDVNKTVTLQMTMPTIDAVESQLAKLRNPGSTWTIYEIMPIDSHFAFADDDVVGQLYDDQREQTLFGQVDDATIQQLFRLVVESSMTDAQRQAIINNPNWPEGTPWQGIIESYQRDGEAIPPDDQMVPASSRWTKIQFSQAYPPDRNPGIEVDSQTTSGALEGGYFDSEGKAVAGRLRAEGEVRFRENQIAVLDYEKAEELIQQGICQRIADYYVRPLNDYAFALRDFNRRILFHSDEILRATRDNAALEASIRRVESQIAYRTDEKAKLLQDKELAETELAALTQLKTQLEEQQKQLLARMSELFRRNLGLSEALTEVQQRLADEINSRTAQIN